MPPAQTKTPHDAKKEAREAVRGMRPRLGPWINGLAANLVLAAVLIGFPWWRGRTRAEMAVQAYVAYAACLHAGTVRQAPGLSLPEHHRERFAALYVQAVPEWPASCRDELDRIPQEEAFLLFPGAKSGEGEVRAAVTGARSALDALAEARASAQPRQIPHRLLRSLDLLAAAVSVLIEETGLTIAPEHLAFDLGDGPSLVEASRVPLQTAMGGPLRVAARSGGLRAVAADGRSIAVVTVHDGTVDITQVRRPPSARAVIDDGATTYLGWVTGDATCAHDEARCAHRLTGLARVRDGVQSPAPEVWIAAHPALSLARSFVLDGTTLQVFAREADGTTALRTFALPEPWPDPLPEGTPPAPIVATAPIALGAARDVVLVDGSPIETADHDALLACGGRVIAIDGGAASVLPARTDPVAPDAAHALPALPLGTDVAPPLRGVDPLEDHARCAASGGGVSFAWIDRAGTLHVVPDVTEPEDHLVAEHVAGFAMSRANETILFATWGEDGSRQVTLRRVWHGRVLSSEVAAACWDDGVGLCGPAGLAANAGNTILFAREQTDLLVLRVTGTGFAPLPGLE